MISNHNFLTVRQTVHDDNGRREARQPWEPCAIFGGDSYRTAPSFAVRACGGSLPARRLP
jgi:hypothetical protein